MQCCQQVNDLHSFFMGSGDPIMLYVGSVLTNFLRVSFRPFQELLAGAGSLQHGESVEVKELPSLERFYMDYMCCPGGGKPCVITGSCHFQEQSLAERMLILLWKLQPGTYYLHAPLQEQCSTGRH